MVAVAQFAGRVDVLEHYVVVYGDVARSFIRHVHVVSLLHQTDERAAHRNHVVVGVGRENHDAFGIRIRRHGARRIVGIGFAARPAGDGVLEVVEYVDVDLVVGAALFEQFAQRIFDVILVGELQDRFLHHAAEPHYGLAGEFGRPFAGAYQPRRLLAGEQLGGVLVDYDFDVGVGLQVRCWHLGRDLAFDDLLDDLGLLFAPSHQDDLVGPHDRVDTHRDGQLRGVVQSEECARLDFAGVVGQLHQPGARLGIGTRLVETDLAVFAHADNHQVDLAHRMVVRGAVLRNLVLGDGAVGDVDVFGQDVDVVEEILVDAEVAALLLGRADGVELVEAEYGHVAEADEALLVAFHQLAVEPQRRAARGKAQHEGLLLFVDFVRTVEFVVGADRLDDGVGNGLNAQIFVFIDRCVNFLVTMDDVARRRFCDQAAVFRK